MSALDLDELTHHGAFARLARTFDAARLERDLAVLDEVERARQPGRYHDGRWVGVSLRSPGGRPGADPSLPSRDRYCDGSTLEATPYFREVLDRIPGPKLGVRLLYLPPGAEIREHADDLLGFWHGLVRLHVPIQTDERVVFRIDGATCRMSPGELWYGDFSRRHSVHNHWDRTRVHLVVDLVVTHAVDGLFPPSFLERYAPAITYTPEEQHLSEPQLRRFVTRVRIPPPVIEAFLPILSVGADARHRAELEAAAAGGLDVELALEDGELVARSDGRVRLHLAPLDERTLKIRDWTAGILLHFRGAPTSPQVILELRLPPGPPAGGDPIGQLVPLPLLNDLP